jgi:sterol desaturase/sphingolipid hydroxylase (fatty acid hydroxylase superfamily)
MFDYLDLIALGHIPGFMLLDLVHGARTYETPRFWRLNGLVVTAVTVYLSFQIPYLWDALLGNRSLFDGSGVGPWVGAGLAILVYETAHYAYHRTVHTFDPLWRVAHQMHHAPESLDAFGAYFRHPVDTFMFTSIGTLLTGSDVSTPRRPLPPVRESRLNQTETVR